MAETDIPSASGDVPRYEIVRSVAADFIKRRKGDRIALIGFASEAFLIAPLTFDTNAVADMLDEMTRQTDTRFLTITHHAVTMARMDRLFGVTMGEQGVSQLVSVDLKKAEALVA